MELKAAGTTGSANTDGTINSTVSVNTTAGFSIVKYTGNATSGATVGHGLSSAPACYIVKSRDSAYDWRMYHKEWCNKIFRLESNYTTATTASNAWNDTAPTSSVFSLGNGTTPNANGDNIYSLLLFAEKTGYSKFGSYTGTGDATESPFIYTGFAPAIVIVKRTDASGDWALFDSKDLVKILQI